MKKVSGFEKNIINFFIINPKAYFMHKELWKNMYEMLNNFIDLVLINIFILKNERLFNVQYALKTYHSQKFTF